MFKPSEFRLVKLPVYRCTNWSENWREGRPEETWGWTKLADLASVLELTAEETWKRFAPMGWNGCCKWAEVTEHGIEIHPRDIKDCGGPFPSHAVNRDIFVPSGWANDVLTIWQEGGRSVQRVAIPELEQGRNQRVPRHLENSVAVTQHGQEHLQAYVIVLDKSEKPLCLKKFKAKDWNSLCY